MDRYRRILNGEEAYGEQGTRVEAATSFLLAEMRTQVADAVRERSAIDAQGIPLLISMSGLTPLPTILAYDVLRPKHLLVIYSEKAAGAVDVIGDHVVGPGQLKASQFSHVPVDPTDPRIVYQVINEYLARFNPADGRVILNVTGGKKVMSAAAALAAWQLDLELCYLDGEVEDAIGSVIPGYQRLLLLDNPISIFGEQEMGRAAELFNAGAFDSASRRYLDLSERLAAPAAARFWKSASELYRAWCDLDFEALSPLIENMERALADYRGPLPADVQRQISEQLKFLRCLDSTNASRLDLMLAFHLLGDHYTAVGRHDFAALLYYRTIEGCLAWRLENKYAGFRCDEPDYSLLGEVGEEYARVSAGMPGKESGLPAKVSLVEAAKLLVALKDGFAVATQLAKGSGIVSLASLAATRNHSILAHGFKQIAPSDSQKLGERAAFFLKKLWELERPSDNLDELRLNLAFVRQGT